MRFGFEKQGSTGGMRYALLSCVFVSSCLFLSSCGQISNKISSSSSSDTNVRREKLQKDVPVRDARELARPASSSEGFTTETPVTTLGQDVPPPPGLLSNEKTVFASKGFKMERLFDQKLRSDDARLDRLEGSVQDVHDYVAEISPSVERLVAIERDIQELVGQLETLLNNEPAPTASSQAPVSISPYAAPARAVPQKVSPSRASTPVTNNFGPQTLAAVRTSSSSAKTRIVFDLSEKSGFSYDLDNDAGVLSFIFPDIRDSRMSTAVLSRLKMVSGATVTPQSGGGYVVALDLNREISVINQGKISPTSTNPMYRIFVDLK